VKRFFIGLIGGTVVLLGLIMILLPGPGLLVILGGLAILGSEFIWARRALQRCKSMVARPSPKRNRDSRGPSEPPLGK
jgi:uncharacterized protein (TIGR02611 family)